MNAKQMLAATVLLLSCLTAGIASAVAGGAGVTVNEDSASFTLSNGIITARILKASGDIRSLVYKGNELLTDKSGHAGGYWSHDTTGGASIQTQVTIDPTLNGGERAEVSVKGISGGIKMGHGPGASTDGDFPADIEIRYAIGRGDSGIYTYCIFRHRPEYPAATMTEARFAVKLADTFDWLSADKLRNKYYPRLIPGEDKYVYTAIQFENRAFGFSSTGGKLGFYVVNPSVEYLSGGPTKPEFLVHRDTTTVAAPVVLNYWRSSHYGGANVTVAAGEAWTKVVGPFLLYVNEGASPDAMWRDARAKAEAEARKWPYAWVDADGYVPPAGRSTISGRLVLHDPAPRRFPGSILVGLAPRNHAVSMPNGRSASISWQTDAKHYQFWVRTNDLTGKFSIPHVVPGDYVLYALADGVLGEFESTDIKVAAGRNTNLGELVWTPIRRGRQLWEIGIPNRSATEFAGAQRFFEPDITLQYARLFPQDVTYTIGASRVDQAWFYAQVPHADPDQARASRSGTANGRATPYAIRFRLDAAAVGMGVLRLAICGTGARSVDVAVNGKPAGTIALAPDGTIARHQIQGLWYERESRFDASLLKAGDNILTLTVPAGNVTDGVIYDYLRLELDSSVSAPAWLQSGNTRKPWTRWWWPGNAVDEAGLTAQLEAFAKAGLGGVEITPIYGAKGYEDHYIDYLSPEFMARLEYVGKEARRLGLGVDMATGTGWPFGGPWVTTADALQKVVLRDGKLSGASTGMLVKRAAPGGEGLVINPFSITALDNYVAPFDKAFAAFPSGLLRGQFHDSFEYFDASWAPTLPAVFREMHGYDIQDYAAALLGATPLANDSLGRVKSDYRETLSRMHRDYLAEWKRWSHAHGFIVRNQSHGAPANLLDLYGVADIAETEVFGSTPFPIPGLRRDADAVRHDQSLPQPLVTRMASSASHVMGHPLTSSETATWLRDHWKVALSYVKPEIDRIFLDGINHVFYHGTVFSPQDAPWPGWFFYAATQFNPNNPWWGDFPALNQYVERVQTVLQRGVPDNRVLLYWAIYDEWADPAGLARQFSVHDADFVMGSPTGKLARRLDDAGYAFDYVSDEQIAMTSTKGGALRTPGNTYDVLVVPHAQHMPLATLEKLVALAAGGAKIVFDELPDDVPGLGRLDERRAAFQALRSHLDFTASAAAGVQHARVGNGELYRGDVLSALALTGTAREVLAVTPVDFIRRRTADGYDYFVANLEGTAFAGWVDIGVPAAWMRITDPLTGRTGVARVKAAQTYTAGARGARRARIYLQLRPGESLLLSTSAHNLTREPRWKWLEPAAAPIPLKGRWSIEFLKGGPELPPPLATSTLVSWTTLGGAATERFAGTARYRIEFDAPQVAAAAWRLDLGDVRDSARVRLNGHELATAWSLPLELHVGDALVRGRNVLEVDVTNVAANRIRDMDRRGVNWKIMREINIVNIRYEPFDASGWAIEPAGLLGPVALVPLRHVDVR